MVGSGAAYAEDLNKSVVRVVATRDGGKTAISTGFFFRVDNRIGVLTALHAIVGANTITAKNESYGVQLKLDKVDIAHDLAFLSGAIDAISTPSLAGGSWRSAGVAETIGYPQGIMAQHSEFLKAREVPTQRLVSLTPLELVSAFQLRSSPTLNSDVLDVRGLLQPGYSGAPILATDGKVVGVGNGGLAGGFADVNWAIPIESASWKAAADMTSELKRLAALPAGAAFQNLELSPRIEEIDLAKGELRRLRATVATIRKATNPPFDGTLSVQDSSLSRISYVCPMTRCPDGSLGDVYASLKAPGLAIQEPIHREALSRPGLQQYLLLDQLVFAHLRQTQRAAENHTVPVDVNGYRPILARARTTCHLDADAVDSTLASLSRLRNLENNAPFWSGGGKSPADAVYHVTDPLRLEQFDHDLITIAEAAGQSHDQITKSSVRDVTAMISAEYDNTHLALNDFEKACDFAVTPGLSRDIAVKLHRPGLTDCPSLPDVAEVTVEPLLGPSSTATVVEGCKATISVPASSIGRAKLLLSKAAPYVLSNPTETHELDAREWQASVTASPGMRMVVALLSYAGQCKNLPQVYTMFEFILRSKAQSLRGLFDNDDSKFDYLTAINVIPANRPSTMSVNEIHAYWRTNELLEVLSGLCFSKSGGDFMLSSVFSGDFAGVLPEPYKVDLKVVEDEFQTNRDLHSATMLYALAQEAQARKLDQHVVISLLERARELTLQIPDAARQPLLTALERSLSLAGAPAGSLAQVGSSP